MTNKILHEERPNGAGTGKYRELTEQERDNLNQVQLELSEIEKKIVSLEQRKREILANCTHEFFMILLGSHDVRRCAVCSHSELI